MDAVGGGKGSVGAPYFNATFVPLMVPLLIACVVGAMLSWKRADLAGVLGRLRLAFIGAVIVIVLGDRIDCGQIPAGEGMRAFAQVPAEILSTH